MICQSERITIKACLALFFALACNHPKEVPSAGIRETGTRPAIKTIAIATLMSHPALDAVIQNAEAELARRGFVEGKTARFIRRNANGQPELASIIASEVSSQNPDVVIAITTPMAQAFARVRKGPLVFAAVTDPVSAGLVADLARPVPAITGTSDAFPYLEQLRLVREITPAVSVIGVIFNPGESSAQYGIQQLRRHASELGFRLLEAPITSTTDVAPAAEGLIRGRGAEALMITSDNTSIAGVAGAVQVAIRARKPLYVGDAGSVEQGGLATVSVGYDHLGVETGALAARFLAGERNLPVVVAGAAAVHVNTRAASLMNVKIPSAVLARATVHDRIK